MPDGLMPERAPLPNRLLLSDEHDASVVICDPWLADAPIVFVSDQFTAQTGYPAAEVIGRNCRFLQGPGTDPAVVAQLRQAMRDERPITADLVNYRRDGRPFWNRLRIRPCFAPSGRLTHLVGVQTVLARPLPPGVER